MQVGTWSAKPLFLPRLNQTPRTEPQGSQVIPKCEIRAGTPTKTRTVPSAVRGRVGGGGGGGRFWLAAGSPFSWSGGTIGSRETPLHGVGSAGLGKGPCSQHAALLLPFWCWLLCLWGTGVLLAPSVFQESLRGVFFCYLLFLGGGVKSGTTCAAIWMTSLLLFH